jgi:hypothetical protein
MNSNKFFYAALGGLLVAAFWIASSLLTLSLAAVVFGLTCLIWFGALTMEDYGARFKRFGR